MRPPLPVPSVCELLRRAQVGRCADRDAFLRAVRPVLEGVLRRFDGSLAPHETPEDLVQESSLHILLHLDHPRATNDRQLLAWCRQIAVHLACDHVRISRRRRAISSAIGRDLAAELSATIPGPDEEEAPPAPCPLALRSLRAAIEQLSPDRIDLLEMRIAGRTWPAIAQAHGITVGAARQRYRRSLAQLAAVVADPLEREHSGGPR